MRVQPPLAFTFPYTIAFFGVFAWAYFRESMVISRATKAAVKGHAPHDRGSLVVVMVTQMLSSVAAFTLAWVQFGRFESRHVVFWAGLATVIAGAVLRRVCFAALGDSFTGEVRVRAEQKVIDSGPYRLVRHPAYTAGILLTVGMAVALGSWLGTAIALALTTAGYAYRIAVEERALALELGEPYRSYMSRTRRLIPYVI